MLKKNRVFTDGRACIRLVPSGWPALGHWLYAVGFADGSVKIGRATRPRDRMFSYWRDHRGSAVTWMHVFGRISERHVAIETERAALKGCAACSARINRTEYFRGLDKATALACVRAAYAATLNFEAA